MSLCHLAPKISSELLMWFAQLNGSRSNNEVFEGSLWGFPRPEERTRDRTVTRQLLSSHYSLTQDSTIYIPWCGERKQEKMWWECERERGKWMIEAQNECQQGERAKQGWLGSIHNTFDDIRSPRQRRPLLARQCQPRLAKLLLPVHELS